MYVQKRPGVDEFLLNLDKHFEVCIFTASVQEYADSIIDKLSIKIPKTHRFYRNDCTVKNGAYMKDLSRFNRSLSQIVIVDNSSVSYELQPKNGISSLTWTGSKRDTELMDSILPQLINLIDAEDVRDEISTI